jgi:hypothetical protein
MTRICICEEYEGLFIHTYRNLKKCDNLLQNICKQKLGFSHISKIIIIHQFYLMICI